jgi:hypothetical protein
MCELSASGGALFYQPEQAARVPEGIRAGRGIFKPSFCGF